MCEKAIPFTPNMQMAENILRNINQSDRFASLIGEYIYFSPSAINPGDDHFAGTLRVQFFLCPTGPLSLIAKSDGPTFTSYNIA
jgi:hypothetical protein